MKPQLALHLYKEEAKKKPNHLGVMYWSFIKYDGWYGYYEGGKVFSRAGREIPSCKDLAFKIKETGKIHKGRLVFEILVEDHHEFSIVNGILNRHEIAQGAYVRVHDYIVNPEEQFNYRYAKAKQMVHDMNIREVKLAHVFKASSNMADHREVCEEVWSSGNEGIILKAAYASYYPEKRNYTLMKIKEEVTAELVVVGLEKGEGKYEHTLGALRCRSADGLTHLVSGMTDAQRVSWWTMNEMIVGEVIEIKAMKKLPNGSYREPRFKAIRHDKNESEID